MMDISVQGIHVSPERTPYMNSLVDVSDFVQWWGLEGHPQYVQERATEYMIMLTDQDWFATSWQFQYIHDGVEGVLAVYSCGASTRAQKARAGLPLGIEAPHWEHFQGCWFPNV